MKTTGISRRFAAEQLERIRAWWPFFAPSEAAINDVCRALGWATEVEFEGAVTRIVDTRLDAQPPKIADFTAAVRAGRPKCMSTATEEELVTLFSRERAELVRREAEELADLELRLAAHPDAQRTYEAQMAALLSECAPEGVAIMRRVFHPTVLRQVVGEAHQPRRASNHEPAVIGDVRMRRETAADPRVRRAERHGRAMSDASTLHTRTAT
jgi:hypothetical protein